jgi:excisionase family DNA binding protein
VKPLLTVEEVAEYLKMPIPAIRKHLRNKTLPGVKVGRQWRVRQEDLEEFFNTKKRSEAK